MGDNIVKLMGKVDNLEKKIDAQTQVLVQIRDVLDVFVKSQTYKSLPEKKDKRDVEWG
jgi:hypothetical protein